MGDGTKGDEFWETVLWFLTTVLALIFMIKVMAVLFC